MKTMRMAIVIIFLVMVNFSVAIAGDFDWMADFNVRAQADFSGFQGKLCTRFGTDAAHVSVILNSVDKPADAYMVLRLGEMSKKPPEYVLKEYKSGKGKGWGALAKSLGIKPGSKEFHALKRGQDLYGGDEGKSRGKGKGKGKGKDK